MEKRGVKGYLVEQPNLDVNAGACVAEGHDGEPGGAERGRKHLNEVDHETDAAWRRFAGCVGAGAAHGPRAVRKQHDTDIAAVCDGDGVSVHGPIIITRCHHGAGVGREGDRAIGGSGNKHGINAARAGHMP